MTFPGFTPVQGHTAGYVTPNVSWFQTLTNGLVVEFWESELGGFTATLIDPDFNYKPGQLYISENSEMLDYFNFTEFSQFLNHFWFTL